MGRLFGTDGVRGIANENLTPELALEIGRAAAVVLSDNSRRRPLFVLGGDTRISTEMLAFALASGLCSVGADVIMLGVVPTPAVAYLVGKYKADAGIMVSASHNSAEFNGIKIFSGDGYKLPDALEEQIESIILEKVAVPKAVTGGDVGKVTYRQGAVKDYIDHIKSTVHSAFGGVRIAVDCANGSAAVSAAKLFEQLGANADILYDKPDGININDKCGSTHLEALSAYVVEHKLDLGFAFDGDADRCLCVDDKGELIDGDYIMALCALDLKKRGKLNKDTVVGTVMTNLGFVKFCEENKLNFIATKVGDRFVLEEMLLEEYDFGGEQSGHLIFREFATTGDGQLTAVQLLSLVRRENKKLSELSAIMTRYPQVMVNIPVSAAGKLSFYTDSAVRQAIEAGKKLLGKDGRAVVRVSGTEPLIRVMTEGADSELINKVAADISAVIKERLT
ncbi:MAG: phosphoglucosamine mutase [Oscillospiraceae bacterium]|jgi:phosphoglucosamine mutase|nr:phosphoglucosamine mutase [Oscillospiraceae bacterium]